MKGEIWRERKIVNHHIHIREFVDMDGGCHYKLTKYTISGRPYPVGSFDIFRKENIDWERTKKID